MVKTEWKSPSEIKFNVGDCKSVTIFSCATCANLSGTGGKEGVRYMRRLLGEWGVKVVSSRIVITCCPLAVMSNAIKHHKRYLEKSDGLIVLACSSGVKSAMICDPGIKVVNVLDTLGPVTVGAHCDDPRAGSLCKSCEQCVITFTDGICPVSECPLGKLYGPCKNAPKEGDPDRCFTDPKRECVWVKIRERGDIEKLGQLKALSPQWRDEDVSIRPAPRPISTDKARTRLGNRIAKYGWLSHLYERIALRID